MAISVTKENFDTEVLKSNKPVIIDVFASWCGPCQQMMPIIEELEQEHANFKFVTLNVDEARELSIKYGVISVPTFLFIKNGEVVGKETGYMSKDQFTEKMEAALK